MVRGLGEDSVAVTVATLLPFFPACLLAFIPCPIITTYVIIIIIVVINIVAVSNSAPL
jgi:hypothetical protein